MIISHSRGHEIYFNEEEWRYVDNNELLDSKRSCKKCGQDPIELKSDTGDYVDACLGIISDVKSACCGHGIEETIIIYRDSDVGK